MKIYFESIYKSMKSTTSLWWLITPKINKYWNGELIYIGTRAFYMVIDLRKGTFLDQMLTEKEKQSFLIRWFSKRN